MIQIERRALYNLLRMNWLMDSSVSVEEWQVEDYRELSLEELFERLKEQGIELDRKSFLAFADNFDTPEEMTDQLLGDADITYKEQDKIYLLLFELWRRLEHNKPCLSVFCDELDHQIHLHDRGELQDSEAVEDALSNLQVILDENVDEGVEPQEALELVSKGCANDIESFLYDFISEQIDYQNISYASELLDAFRPYVKEPKWFAFLQVRLVALSDSATAHRYIRQLIKKTEKDPDLAFYLEVLGFLAEEEVQETFKELAKRSVSLLEVEEDFQELLFVCSDFFRQIGNEEKEARLQEILDRRAGRELDEIANLADADIEALLLVLNA